MPIIQEIKKQIREIDSSPRELRKLGVTLVVVFGIIGSLLWWKDRPSWIFFGGIGLVLGLSILIWPKGLRPFYKLWRSWAIIMNYFISRILLILLYYLALTPIGLISRALGRDVLDRKSKDHPSYWNQRHGKESSKGWSSNYLELKQGSRKIVLIVQFLIFLRNRKKFFLLPIILVLIVLGFLLLLGEGSIAPFIYTLF
jgi:hypothetical protein